MPTREECLSDFIDYLIAVTFDRDDPAPTEG